MSDITRSTSDITPTSSTYTSKSKKHNPKKHKYDEIKLPTPPPDPTENMDELKYKDIFEYLESIIPNYTRSTPLFAPVVVADEAFDHLEKLCKLMEQMLDLREQNSKLYKRIRDLERLNKLEKIQMELTTSDIQGDISSDLDKDPGFAESLLESVLSESSKKNQKQTKILAPAILRPSILRRHRSGSGTEKQVTLDANVIVQQQEGCEKYEKSAKVSKWTKVKAAFRWEKASAADNKSQDSGIHVPLNVEVAKYLRVPSVSDDTGHSPADSGAAGISTPGSISTISSNEDFQHSEIRSPYDDLRSSDDETSHSNYIPQHKDEPSSSKSHATKLSRTPWAKMKDIIHPRSSYKKKHRYSAASDDIHIDIECCSDNDDNVFEDEVRYKTNPSSSCSSRKNSIPQEILDRYQKAVEEDAGTTGSKWTRVKRAFLDRQTSRNYTLSPNKGVSIIEYEIQRDYKKLQKKLSLEFQEKVSEWERLKQNSPSTSTPSPSGFSEENRDPNFMRKIEEWHKIKSQQVPKSPLPSEFDLPPDFKKKLQEWEKIKKFTGSSSKKKLGDVPKWKSLSGHRYASPSAFEYPVLSDEFKKKLEEWKQIKSSGGNDPRKFKEKTPSPKLSRKNSFPRQSKKQKDVERDSHWFEKELSKVEKEKQRLERERQKYLEREERLSKLRKSIIGEGRKEVLIHTPSGFYKFEGISRKFTQKLYEWEKAQGIAPEASTFTLLSSSYTPGHKFTNVRDNSSLTPSMMRSKSADSIAIPSLNLASPLLSQPPSSLSLNDMEELEKEYLIDSRDSSMEYLLGSQEDLDVDEPQAVLVEVEDYEEETAAPLHTVSEKQQLPVYQREEFKTLCAGETIAAPKVRRSESTRAQTSYNLIEDIMNILRYLTENELVVRNITQLEERQAAEIKSKLKKIYENQKHYSCTLLEKITRLQEENSVVASAISRELNCNQTHLNEILGAVQDLSCEVFNMAEKIDNITSKRTPDNFSIAHTMYLPMLEHIRDIRSRILELRRHLSYLCAASDTTAPSRKRNSNKIKTSVYKTISNESKSSRCDTSDNSRKGSQKEEKHYIKGENSNISSSQGAVKKRIKYRQKSMVTKSIIDTDDDDEGCENKDQTKNIRPHKKLTRTKTFSESEKEIISNELRDINSPVQDVLVSTAVNLVRLDLTDESKVLMESPLTLFVKTTRKLFTPIGEANLNIDDSLSSNTTSPKIIVGSHDFVEQSKTKDPGSEENPGPQEVFHEQDSSPKLSLLPSSPIPQRKLFKEISPSIRLMLAKYNQRISEQDNKSTKSGNSSGSNSPLWRSPKSERRVKAQTEKYQEELSKLSPLLGSRREVQKSASVGYIYSGNKQVTLPMRRDSVQDNMLQSPSEELSGKEELEKTETTLTSNERSGEVARKSLTLDISRTQSDTASKHSPEIRQKKLQQAKEEFLKSPTSDPLKMSNEELSFPTRCRLSQISVDSDTSYEASFPGALIKSVSAGMINIDPDSYRQIDPELHGGGYVSLPRSTSHSKSNKFTFSKIAAKFRKVKMRKGKDRDKAMNTISALCRQSLVVDISKVEESRKNNISTSAVSMEETDVPSSNSSSRSNSWIKKSLFKK